MSDTVLSRNMKGNTHEGEGEHDGKTEMFCVSG